MLVLPLLILAAGLAVTALVMGLRRVRGKARPFRNADYFGFLAAATFPLWVWPCGMVCAFVSGSMRGGCVPYQPSFRGAVATVLVTSAPWPFLLGAMLGRGPVVLAPAVGAAAALLTAGLLEPRTNSVSEPYLTSLAWASLAWVVAQAAYGALVLRPAPVPGRCDRCGYDRAGLAPTARCPECGVARR